MKSVIVAILLPFAASFVLTGCRQPSQDRRVPVPRPRSSAAQSAHRPITQGPETGKAAEGIRPSRFNDAKIYCLGMMLYAKVLATPL